MRAIVAYLVQRRPGQHPPHRPRMARAFGFIIAVEQEGVARIERLIARHMIAQNEGFEEPGAMRQMPFGRRRIGHRLDRRIGIGQGKPKRLCQRPHLAIARHQRIPVQLGPASGHACPLRYARMMMEQKAHDCPLGFPSFFSSRPVERRGTPGRGPVAWHRRAPDPRSRSSRRSVSPASARHRRKS